MRHPVITNGKIENVSDLVTVESAPPQPVAAQEGEYLKVQDSGWKPFPRKLSPSPAATTQPESKPAPQAEGFEQVWKSEESKGWVYGHLMQTYPQAFRHVAETFWSAAQAPLLQKIAELEASLEIQQCECSPDEACALFQRAKKAEARIAELESAQPKAEPVEPMVSAWDLIDAITTGDEKSRFIAAELQQYRQREETKEQR